MKSSIRLICFFMFIFCGNLIHANDQNEIKIISNIFDDQPRNSTDNCSCFSVLTILNCLKCRYFPSKTYSTEPNLIVESTFIVNITRGQISSDFKNLKYLTLQGNAEGCLTSIEDFAFETLTEVETLNITFNPNLIGFTTNVFYGMKSLKYLDLSNNNLTDIQQIALALSPNNVPALFELILNENSFEHMKEHDFDAMSGSNVERLFIERCSIENLDQKALVPLKKLKLLHIGGNKEGIYSSELANLLNETINAKIDLEELDLQSSGFWRFRWWPPADNSVMKVIAKSNISILTLSDNRLSVIKPLSFGTFLPNIKTLNMNNVNADSVVPETFAYFPNLITLSLRNNRLNPFPGFVNLPNLKSLDLLGNGRFYVSPFDFGINGTTGLINLEELNLQSTNLVTLTKTSFGNMKSIRTLSLKDCGIRSIKADTFKYFSNLKILNLEDNLLSCILYSTSIRLRTNMFSGLKNLEELYLGGNNLHDIVELNEMFKNVGNLQILNLNKNNIMNITEEQFSSLPKLKSLSLSENYIQAWENPLFGKNSLTHLNLELNSISYISDGMLEDFQNLNELKFSLNPIVCDCKNAARIHSAKYALEKFQDLVEGQELYCIEDVVSISEYLEEIKNSSVKCSAEKVEKTLNLTYWIFGISTVSVLTFITFIGRRKIKYYIFLANLRLRKTETTPQNSVDVNTAYTYDAFISYDTGDREFIELLIKNLENTDPFFKVCIYERDFKPGNLVTRSIVEHMMHSRKTVIVLSESYLHSELCVWGSKMAEHHKILGNNNRRRFNSADTILIKLGPINENLLPTTLKYSLKTRIYLEWTDDLEEQTQFWKKLKTYLDTARSEDGIINSQELHI